MRPETRRDYQERMLQVLVHIQHHLDRMPTLEELARVAHFSPFHFHRIFKGMVGESVQEHIRRLRLERAAQHLKHTDRSVLSVALAAGYETHESFTRAFKAQFGQPPSAFRERIQSRGHTTSPSNVHYTANDSAITFHPVKGALSMQAKIQTLGPLRVAFMRHVGPYHQVGETWNKLCTWAGPRGLLGPNTTFLGVCHDDPEVTPPDKIRYDACLQVDENVEAKGDVGVQVIPAGEYATTRHHGPYEKLSGTYARLCGEWLPQQGREPSMAPCLEFYRNSPEQTPAEDLLTDVFVPLA